MKLFDDKGNSVSYLTQWEQNRVLKANADLSKEYIAHVFNSKSAKAKAVPVTVGVENVSFPIPNVLLQESATIFAILYEKAGDVKTSIGKAVLPVVECAKPEDYEFVENIEYTDWVALSDEARALLSEMRTATDNAVTATDRANTAAERAESAAAYMVDAELSDTSENPVQNKVVKSAIDLKADKTYVDDTFAPVVKVDKQGTVISIDDISEIPQIMTTRVESANLIPYPYESKTMTSNGVTLTDNGDGAITINGTASDAVQFNLHIATPMNLAIDGVTLTGCPEGVEKLIVQAGIKKPDGNMEYLTCNSSTLQPHFRGKGSVQFAIVGVRPGAVLNNIVVKPMLNKGTTALPFTPYVPNLEETTVKAMGGNLCPEAGFTMTKPANRTKDITFKAPAGSYNISLKKISNTTTKNVGIVVQTISGNISKQIKTGVGEEKYTIIAEDEIKGLYFFIASSDNDGVEITVGDIQFSVKEQAYEPYIEPVIYPVLADGTVNRVKGIYPNMTLIGENILINTSYRADTKKYIDNKFKELAQMNAQTQALALER